MKLTYGDREVEFGEILNLDQIKEGFHIVDTKNLYRVNSSGELVQLEKDTWTKHLKEGDRVEAISEFSLG